MLKKLIVLMVLLAVVFTALPVSAAESPVIYKSTITVTNEGGRYQVGFVNIEFKKEFLTQGMLPVTINVEVSAVDGVAGIELDPSINNFCKKVHIRVDSYEGLLYDKTSGKNIQVDVQKQQRVVTHFSRHAFS